MSDDADRLERTPRARAVVELVRERVREHTRRALGLPATAVEHAPHFAELPPPAHPNTEAGSAFTRAFVGRLLSDQNLLAGEVHGRVDPATVRAAVEEGMQRGLEESLQIVEETESLDDEAWELVSALLIEFQRKLLRGLG